MSRKNPNYAKAYHAASRLEAWVAAYLPSARRHATRLLEAMARPIADSTDATATLAKDTIAVAVLMEEPHLSDREIARRVGCDRKTLQRSTRFQTARGLLAKGREKYAPVAPGARN